VRNMMIRVQVSRRRPGKSIVIHQTIADGHNAPVGAFARSPAGFEDSNSSYDRRAADKPRTSAIDFGKRPTARSTGRKSRGSPSALDFG
jgi:hypothetical protein